jgi:hypothetical protein
MATKTQKTCQHLTTIHVGTETTVEVWCVECKEVVKTGKPIKSKKI